MPRRVVVAVDGRAGAGHRGSARRVSQAGRDGRRPRRPHPVDDAADPIFRHEPRCARRDGAAASGGAGARVRRVEERRRTCRSRRSSSASPAPSPSTDDRSSVIGFRSRPDLDRTLGATTFTFDDVTGEILESDIFLNTTFDWSVAPNGETDRFDVESILVHEVGHLLGFGHSASAKPSRVRRRPRGPRKARRDVPDRVRRRATSRTARSRPTTSRASRTSTATRGSAGARRDCRQGHAERRRCVRRACHGVQSGHGRRWSAASR